MTSHPRYRALFPARDHRCIAASGNSRDCWGDDRKDRTRQFHDINPDAVRRIIADIWRAVGSARSVVCNFPIVAWKRVMFAPLMAMAIARLRGSKNVLIQHKFRAALAAAGHLPPRPPARRYHRDVLAAGAPRTGRGLAWSAGPHENACWRRCRRTSRRRPGSPESKLRQRLAAAREDKRLVIGHFGSIYPAKQPNALLEIGAILKATRAQAADRLYRLVHPRHRQGRGRILCARPPSSASPTT